MFSLISPTTPPSLHRSLDFAAAKIWRLSSTWMAVGFRKKIAAEKVIKSGSELHCRPHSKFMVSLVICAYGFRRFGGRASPAAALPRLIQL